MARAMSFEGELWTTKGSRIEQQQPQARMDQNMREERQREWTAEGFGG